MRFSVKQSASVELLEWRERPITSTQKPPFVCQRKSIVRFSVLDASQQMADDEGQSLSPLAYFPSIVHDVSGGRLASKALKDEEAAGRCTATGACVAFAYLIPFFSLRPTQWYHPILCCVWQILLYLQTINNQRLIAPSFGQICGLREARDSSYQSHYRKQPKPKQQALPPAPSPRAPPARPHLPILVSYVEPSSSHLLPCSPCTPDLTLFVTFIFSLSLCEVSLIMSLSQSIKNLIRHGPYFFSPPLESRRRRSFHGIFVVRTLPLLTISFRKARAIGTTSRRPHYTRLSCQCKPSSTTTSELRLCRTEEPLRKHRPERNGPSSTSSACGRRVFCWSRRTE